MFRRVPRDEAFYGLLGRTAAHTLAAARELPALLGATSDAERKAVAKAIADLEGAGDAATHEVIRSATAAFLTPFDRADLITLARALDNCLDQIELAADLVRLHRLSTFPPRVGRQVDTILRMSELTVEAMPRLRSPESLADFWIEINRLENLADDVLGHALSDLFKTNDALRILKFKDIYEELERATDRCETVANIISDIVIRHS